MKCLTVQKHNKSMTVMMMEILVKMMSSRQRFIFHSKLRSVLTRFSEELIMMGINFIENMKTRFISFHGKYLNLNPCAYSAHWQFVTLDPLKDISDGMVRMEKQTSSANQFLCASG